MKTNFWLIRDPFDIFRAQRTSLLQKMSKSQFHFGKETLKLNKIMLLLKFKGEEDVQ